MNNSLHSFRGFALAALLLAFRGTVLAAEPIRPAKTPPAPDFNRLHTYEEMVAYLQGYAAAYPELGEARVDRQEHPGPRHVARDDHESCDRRRRREAGDVRRRQHPRQRGAGGRGDALRHQLRPEELRHVGADHRDARPLGVLLRAVVNPDGRAAWFRGPSTADFPRTVMFPVDDDRDGRVDEDPYDDMDGDGQITRMRKKVPMGQGTVQARPEGSAHPRARRERRARRLDSARQRKASTTTATASVNEDTARLRRSEPDLGLGLAARLRAGRRGATIRCPSRRRGRSRSGRSDIPTSEPCRASTTTAR